MSRTHSATLSSSGPTSEQHRKGRRHRILITTHLIPYAVIKLQRATGQQWEPHTWGGGMLGRIFHLSTEILNSKWELQDAGGGFWGCSSKSKQMQVEKGVSWCPTGTQRGAGLGTTHHSWETSWTHAKAAGKAAHNCCSHSTTPATSTAAATCKPGWKLLTRYFQGSIRWGWSIWSVVKNKGMLQFKTIGICSTPLVVQLESERIYSQPEPCFLHRKPFFVQHRFQKDKGLLCTCGDATLPCSQMLTC